MFNPLQHIKIWAKRYDQWAQERKLNPVLVDEAHCCTNCNTEYQGLFCPQCGLKASISRLRIKNLFQNFLDIWGMGSRPMFRSISELFTRPGYMIREYLSGHQPLYFPPFKMLVVITVIYIMVAWLRGVPIDGVMGLNSILENIKADASEHGRVLLVYVGTIISWFNEHLAFAVILGQTISVLATRIAFRKAEDKWSLVELFFAHIYMASQYYIVASLCILLFKAELDEYPALGLLSVVILLLQWLTHAQLYNMGCWKSLLGLIRKTFWQIVIYVFLIISLFMIVIAI